MSTYCSFLPFSLSDPYLNTDAGTMSPFEHGEVYVLDDGGEVRHKSFMLMISYIILDSLILN